MTSPKEKFREWAVVPPPQAPATLYDVCLIGSGMGSLSAASLLAKQGLKVAVLEQNYLPGGCTSAYWRKGFVFESGATTLVGLDDQMPLRWLLDRTGVALQGLRKLALPMLVHLPNGQTLHKHESLDDWIAEAEKAFGPKGQRAFWRQCKEISNFVWETSLKQTAFPPATLDDLWQCARLSSHKQVRFARWAFSSMKDLLRAHGLLENELFVRYVNEQLLITAQNRLEQVNVLFGATALCYTNYGNYYLEGGLINLAMPFVEYIKQQGGEVWLRTEVQGIGKEAGGYRIYTHKQGSFRCKRLISGIPLNNTLHLAQGTWGENLLRKLKHKILPSEEVNSAFQMGLALSGGLSELAMASLHHQVHLQAPLPEIASEAGSIFVSFSPSNDPLRTDEAGHTVASVSTHVPHPAKDRLHYKEAVARAILDRLEEVRLIRREQLVYQHASTPNAWEQWTKRQWGFVGGYPQLMRIKPWQMVEARLDRQGAYICGDTAYPGQGIPGVVLSGIIAAEKLMRDGW